MLENNTAFPSPFWVWACLFSVYLATGVMPIALEDPDDFIFEIKCLMLISHCHRESVD